MTPRAQIPGASEAGDLADFRERVQAAERLFSDLVSGHAALASHPHMARLVGEIETRLGELFEAASGATMGDE